MKKVLTIKVTRVSFATGSLRQIKKAIKTIPGSKKC